MQLLFLNKMTLGFITFVKSKTIVLFWNVGYQLRGAWREYFVGTVLQHWHIGSIVAMDCEQFYIMN